MTQSIAAQLCRAAFWPYLGQDKHMIVKLVRVTPASGIRSSYMFNSEITKVPIEGALTHLFLLPTMAYGRWNKISTNDQRKMHIGVWMPMKDNWDSFDILFDLYTYTGISIPLSMLYYKVSNNGAMHFAVVGDFSRCGFNPEVDDLYIKMYDNIYYRAGLGDLGDFKYYGSFVENMTQVADLVTLQMTLDLDKCFCFRNGYLIDKHDVAKSALGDYVELYKDYSIDYKYVRKISDLPIYNSSEHQSDKYVFALDFTDELKDQQRYIVDDLSFYLYNEDLKKGVYLHPNEKKNINNLTHNIFSISTSYVGDVSEKHGSDFELSKCSILVVCRKDSTEVSAFGTTLALADLYRVAKVSDSVYDSNQVSRLICSNQALAQWRGNGLEQGIMGEYLKSNYGQSDTLSKDLMGYHSLFDVYGPSLQAITPGYYVPGLFAQSYSLQTFDVNGFSTKIGVGKDSYIRPFATAISMSSNIALNSTYFGGTLPSFVKYYPKLALAQINSSFTLQDNLASSLLVDSPKLDNDCGLYDTHLSGLDVVLKPAVDYRFYYKGVNDLYYSYAVSGVHYDRVGDTLKWKTNSAVLNTCIRSSEDGYAVHSQLTLSKSGVYKGINRKLVLKYTPAVLNGHVGVGSIDIGGGYIQRHEDVLWGYIHLYINGKRMIENIDYCVDRVAGHLVVYSSAVMLDENTDKVIDYSIYCFGHPQADMNRVKALEFGVIYNNLLSNNSKYESYRYRNCSMIVNGATLSMDNATHKLADEFNSIAPLSTANSLFYLIEDNYYDVGHMYQSHVGFSSSEQMLKERDFRIQSATCINAYKSSVPTPTNDIAINRTVLVSAFLNSFIMDVIYGVYDISGLSSIDVQYHRQNVKTLYQGIFDIDPVARIGSDLYSVSQHIDLYPTYCNYSVGISLEKYNFISKVIKSFIPSLELNRFFDINS